MSAGGGEMPASVRDYVFYGRAPFVVRVDLKGWEPAAGWAGRFPAPRSPGLRLDDEEMAEAVSKAPVGLLRGLFGVEKAFSLEHLARERAALLTAFVDAPLSLYASYRYGLGWLP